jgi:hypothetical protein
MAEFTSRSVGSAGLATGIIGTSLGALNSGILGNLFGNGNCGCSENMPVNRYELQQEQKIAALEAQIALRDSNIYVDSKILEAYKDLNGKIEGINARLGEQAVFNATSTATIGCISNQVAQLFALTKLVVPNTSICPGWGTVTVTPATTTTA